MRLIALISWYDEPLPALAACLTSLRRAAGVDHVVALDGRYALFPGDAYLSPTEQSVAIDFGCRDLGMDLTLLAPDSGPWPGEPEKRTALFAAGLEVAEPGDWFLVMDADQVVTRWPEGVREELDSSPHETGDVTFHDETLAQTGGMADFPTDFPMRILFRAQEVRVEEHHARYLSADGRILWSGRQSEVHVPGADLTAAVTIDHRPMVRPTERQLAKSVYYTTRDELGVERGRCDECQEREATQKVRGRWRLSKDFRGRIIGEILELCDACAADRAEKDRRRLIIMGKDPDRPLSINEHYGHVR